MAEINQTHQTLLVVAEPVVLMVDVDAWRAAYDDDGDEADIRRTIRERMQALGEAEFRRVLAGDEE